MVSFGGIWTQKKLEILGEYLDRYTTVLKNQRFRLIYVDAFAGEGEWRSGERSGYTTDVYGDFQKVHEGSPKIALSVQKRPFDRFVFIEKDPNRCYKLESLRSEFPNRDMEIRHGDANSEIDSFCKGMGNYDRAVVFLDPFATQVSWNTVSNLAQTEKVDCWILFPLSAIARMMPVESEPSEAMAGQLDRIFGKRQYWWEDVYHPPAQQNMFDEEPGQVRTQGSKQIAACYRNRLEDVFKMVAPTPRTFYNSKQSPLFELFFAASNPTGAPKAVRIADHILKKW
ncbi:MAG: three-Cys-motif partner protein TcmP [Gemmatimonadetes bacterium]|nr:three-Cys-motif partner protein TcmP [Gemmatimonadota bacterium]MYG86068.1 three-Cys-motif partner protein TcmP [Gemmatimonadota bacterium]MYJ90970.1 three-Cys-motif partner protein TcmP [Gemmatimonadota bacterium]